MKSYFTFFIYFLGLYNLIGQNLTDFRYNDTVGLEPGVSHYLFEHISRNSSTLCDCWDAELVITKNGQVVNAVAQECLQDYQYHIRLEYTCLGTDGESQEFFCDYHVRIELEGGVLENYYIDGENHKVDYHSGSLLNLLERAGTPNEFTFDIIISKTLTGMGLEWGECRIPLSFNYLSTEGQYYTKVYFDHNSPIIFRDYAEGCDPRNINNANLACCTENEKIIFRGDYVIRHEQTQSTSGEICINSGVELSGGVTTPGGSIQFSSGFDTETCFEAKTIDGLQQNFTSRTELECRGAPGKCYYIGSVLVYREIVTEKYKVSCDEYDPLQPFEIERKLILTGIRPKCCEHQSECEGLNPDYFDPQGIMNGNLMNDCSGRIELNSSYSDIFRIEWVGPNGFSSAEENIYNLEPGIYTYTIRNQCCEEISGTVELCDDPVRESWVYNTETEEYCRTVKCKEGGPAFKWKSSLCEYLECVIADQTISDIDGLNCIEKDYYQGELLGIRVMGPVETEVEYDQDIERCFQRIICQGDLVEEIEEHPYLEEWNYDEDKEECVRMVICFGEEFQEIFRDPDIDEEYEERANECTMVVNCKGDEIEYEDDPYYISDWSWSESRGCEKEVRCRRNGRTKEIGGEESFYDTEYDESDDICYSAVRCNGDRVHGELKYSEPSKGDWQWGTGDPCIREVYCPYSNETFFEYVDPDFRSTGDTCTGTDVLIYEVFCDGMYMGITNCLGGIDINDRSALRNRTSDDSPINIYPNPFSKSFIVDLNEAFENDDCSHFSLFDMDGRKVLEGTLNRDNVDASTLTKGVYYCQINCKGQVYFEKLIKL